MIFNPAKSYSIGKNISKAYLLNKCLRYDVGKYYSLFLLFRLIFIVNKILAFMLNAKKDSKPHTNLNFVGLKTVQRSR